MRMRLSGVISKLMFMCSVTLFSSHSEFVDLDATLGCHFKICCQSRFPSYTFISYHNSF